MGLKRDLKELYDILDKSLLSLKNNEKNLNLEEKVSKNFFQKFFRVGGTKSNNDIIEYDKLRRLLKSIYSFNEKNLVLDENLIESLIVVYRYLSDEEQILLSNHFNEAVNNTKENLIIDFKDKCNEFFDLLSRYDLSNKFVYKDDEVLGTYVSVFNKLRNGILDCVFDFKINNYIEDKNILDEELEELKKIYIERESLTKVVNSITECVSNLKVNDLIDFSKSVVFLEEVKNKKMILLEEKNAILEDESNLEKIEKAIENIMIDEVNMEFYYELAYKLFKAKTSSNKDYDEISKLELEMMEYSNKHNFSNIERIDASLVALERYSNEIEEKESVVLNKNVGLSIYKDLVYKLYKTKKNNSNDIEKIKKLEEKINACTLKYKLSNIELIESNLNALERFNSCIPTRLFNKNKGINTYEKLVSSLYQLKKSDALNVDEIKQIERKIKKCSSDYKLTNIDKINSQFKILEKDL